MNFFANQKPLNLVIIFVIGITILSCQKELSPDDLPPVIPVTIDDSNYISKMGFIDPAGILKNTISFEYDNLKRISTITDSSLDNQVTNTVFYYNSNDTLPFKSYAITAAVDFADTVTKYIYYNTAGKRIKDSAFINEEDITDYTQRLRIINYTYSGNNIYGDTHNTLIFAASGGSAGVEFEKDTATLDINGNVVHNIKHRYDMLPFEQISTAVITYDNNPSPFTRFALFAFPVFPTGETFLTEMAEYTNRLTIVENTVDNLGNPQHHFEDDYSGFYLYKSNGQPREINFANNPANPNSSTDRVLFIYKHL